MPFGIAAGPDGNIWFAERASNKIGMIDLADGTYAFTEFDIPTDNTQPVGIVAGPDGNVWFTESGYGQIASIDVAGGTYAITEYPLPGVFPFPQAIIAGPDGNMWFTETGGPGGYGNNLGYIDLAGGTYGITELPVPTPNSSPVGLTVGPSGNDIWFVEARGNQVGETINPPGPGHAPSGGHGPSGRHGPSFADVSLLLPGENETHGALQPAPRTRSTDPGADGHVVPATSLLARTRSEDPVSAVLTEDLRISAVSADDLVWLVF
jgi:hypothetical protein